MGLQWTSSGMIVAAVTALSSRVTDCWYVVNQADNNNPCNWNAEFQDKHLGHGTLYEALALCEEHDCPAAKPVPPAATPPDDGIPIEIIQRSVAHQCYDTFISLGDVPSAQLQPLYSSGIVVAESDEVVTIAMHCDTEDCARLCRIPKNTIVPGGRRVLGYIPRKEPA